MFGTSWNYIVDANGNATIGNGTTNPGNAINSLGVSIVPGEVSVSIPSQIDGHTVIAIGQYAFQGSIITSIEIPGTVTTIGQYAFNNCFKLTSVNIPNSVTTIGSGAFTMTGLTYINVPSRFFNLTTSAGYEGNSFFSNNVLVSKKSYYDFYVWMSTQTAALYNLGYTYTKSPYDVFPHLSTLSDKWNDYFANNNQNIINTDGTSTTFSAYALQLAEVQQGWNTVAYYWAYFRVRDGTYSSQPSQYNSFLSNYQTIVFNDYCVFTTANLNGILAQQEIVNQLNGYRPGLRRCGSQQPSTPNLAISFHSSVKSLGQVLFGETLISNTFITSVSIRGDIEDLEYPLFAGCQYLTNITVTSPIVNYMTEAGVLFTANKSTLIQYPIGKAGTSYKIPSQVTTIGTQAFANSTNLAYIHFPNGLATIGDRAFVGCTNFKGYTSSNTTINLLSVTTIGQSAFNGCSSLTYVNTSDLVTSLGNAAFQNCSNLTYMYISRGLTQIKPSTFSGCASLLSITIPDSVTIVDESAFRYCSKVNELRIGDWVSSIGAYAFDGCSQLSELVLPPSVVRLGQGAFTNCAPTNFSVTMSNDFFDEDEDPLLLFFGGTNWNMFQAAFVVNPNTTNIHNICLLNGYYAFSPSNGNALTATDVYNTISSLRLSSNYTSKTYIAYIRNDVEIIGDGAFQMSTNLTTIYLSTSVKTIGSGAFQGCIALNTFTINNFTHSQLATIGDRAFIGTDINMAIIPDSTTYIGKWAFYKVLVSEVIFYPGTKIDTIDDYCFASCTNLKTLRLPNKINSIGKYAFSNCIRLTEILFPSTLKSIGEYAFEGCTNLGWVNIPSSVTYIGQNAFSRLSPDFGALSISSQYSSNISNLVSVQDITTQVYKAYLFKKSNYDYNIWLRSLALDIQTEVFVNTLTFLSEIWDKQISTTAQYNNPIYDVNGIYQGTFGEKLHSSISITIISKNWSDQTLANITLNTLNAQKIDSEDAWLSLQNTPPTYASLSGQDIIYKYTFNSTTGTLTANSTLTANMVSSTVINGNTGYFAATITNDGTSPIVKIGENAFANRNIVSITFPDTLTEIASGAFSGSKLSGLLSIPNTVTTIGDGAFQDCSGITHIIIPDSVATIGQNAFRGCGISYIIIPSSVNAIGVGAFQNCAQLINVYVPIPPSTPPAFYTNYNTSSAYFNTGTASPSIKYNYTLDFYPSQGNTVITQAAVTNIIGGFTGNFVANIDGISNTLLIDIDDNAFSGTKITTVIIGNYVEGIGVNAFKNCAQLTNVSIGSGIQTIGAGAFSNCQNLQTVKIPSKMYNTCNSAYFSSGLTILYKYYCVLSAFNEDGILSTYDVESQLDVGTNFNSTISVTFDTSVSIIDDNAFNGNPYVDNIIITPTIITIGNYAFANCANMESLVCVGEDESLLYSIGEYACYNCGQLSTVVLPLSLLNIGTMAFVECSNLYSVVLPSVFDYSYMTNTTAYFVTTNQENVGWDSSTPDDATGTFFTFHFEMAPGYFCSYSYEKTIYINQQNQNYNQEQAKKAAKRSFWEKIGWDILTAVVLVVATVMTDGIADFAVTAALGEAEAVVSTTAYVVRKLLTASVATGIRQGEDKLVTYDKNSGGVDPFTDASSVDASHSNGSWIATFAFTTTNRINVDALSAYVDAQVRSTINGLFGDRFINDPPIVDCTQTALNQYIVTITLDIDFSAVTDEDKTVIENVVKPVIASFVNPNYTGPAPTYGATVSVANICFPANTPINTDQGIVSIKKIDPVFHTINKNRIVAITQTITLAKYLICFKRDSLGKNYPAEDTIMSKEHKVYYMGRMIEAKHFVGRVKNVYKIPYNGEILYNVLMERYNKLKVNNLICETLHPENVVAQLCLGNFNESDKGDIVKTLNNCVYKNSPKEYEALVKYISKQTAGEKPHERLKLMSFSK